MFRPSVRFHELSIPMDFFWCILLLATFPLVHSTSDINFKNGNELTAVIEETEIDGHLIYEGHGYQNETSQRIKRTHYRICQRKVKSCIRKCCGPRQFMVDGVCTDPSNGTGDPNEPEFNDIISKKYKISNFHITYENGCPKNRSTVFYPDDYVNVDDRLLDNGSMSIVFDNDITYILDEFCLDGSPSQRNGSRRMTLDILICIPREISASIYDFPFGMAMSVPFLLATLAIYSLKELQNIQGKNVQYHVASLLTAYISVILVELTKNNISPIMCIGLGLVRQFSFLSSFFWLNVMCIDVWWSLSSVFGFKTYTKKGETRRFLIYCSCGWGCPAVIISLTTIFQFVPVPDSIIKPGIGVPGCFLQDGRPFYYYFYGPVVFVFCTDITLFILSAVRFIINEKKMKSSRVQERIQMKNIKRRYFITLKIFLMMGINWIIDPFSWILEESVWTRIFIHISVTLQAMIIFITFVWKTEIMKLLKTKFCTETNEGNTSISLLTIAPSRNINTASQNIKTTQTSSC